MKIALALTLAALAGGAFAQMGHVDKHTKRVIACAITGEKLDLDAATRSHLYADYKGNRYFFCCGDCPSTFKKNPDKYAGKPHVKVPKAK